MQHETMFLLNNIMSLEFIKNLGVMGILSFIVFIIILLIFCPKIKTTAKFVLKYWNRFKKSYYRIVN